MTEAAIAAVPIGDGAAITAAPFGWPEVAAILRARFEAEWPEPSVPAFWENENNALPDSPASFLFIEIIPDDEFQIEQVGSNRNHFHVQGAMLGHCFVPKGVGNAPAFVLAEQFGTIFRGRRFDGVNCEAVTIDGDADDADDGNYWRVAATVDFSFDRIG